MIPTKATDAQLAGYVANIQAAYESATPAQILRSATWYQTANDLAKIVGNGNVRMGAGVIACLSAQRSWSVNCDLARDAGNGNVHGQTGAILAKVARIMAGTDPADILPMDLKTGMFYRLILDPNDAEATVIDRHVHDIAAGETYGERPRGLSNRNRFATVANAYRVAANAIGIPTSQLCTLAWIVQSERV